ncbi:anaerobic glycerol-3-phosphate dehydrogenase subunit C [Haloarculaceae archaeon H-GB2-1]|nr:anaerobic glycerol-3-phosphate dehydrogenase subunit C [Haloarculaceae archaeon H-GB1-1]MEA5408084.1 anaerobic glycerol-3-phosphate dehydrogenase subunit C [Haloarculaceae archaeon H-GB2-1]
MSDATDDFETIDVFDEEPLGDDFDPVDVFDGEDMDLRPGADSCYKCSTCDSSCPVAEVDEDFPGPKFQGPEQWRLKRKDDVEVDSSVMKCSNCMRCDGACPADVPLSQMHNTARAEYVEENLPPFSREYLRNRILANYGRLAKLGSAFPRLTNALMGSSAVQWLNEKLLGITSEREFPAFAEQTFRSWWDERGGANVQSEDRRIAYFHGDYANHNTPEVAKSLVRVFEHYGYEVAVPEQRCSGTPMFANGMLDDARRAAKFNVETFRELVADGYDVVCSCTSCSMALRQEYPELFSFDGTATVAASTYEALEYLRIHEDVADDLAEADAEYPDLAYHAPCHARNQGLDTQAIELLDGVDGVDVEDVGDSCSGISGTYGWKAENYDTAMQIGAEMFEHMEAVEGDTGLTECPTCAMQMEHGTGYEVQHPLQVVEAALCE